MTGSSTQVLRWLDAAATADVQATAEPLRRASEAVAGLRPEIGGALALPKPQRADATLKAAEAKYQALLSALAAANEAVDAAIPRQDTALASDLDTKRSTWKARTAIGIVATRIQTSLAGGTAWMPTEAIAAAEERGRLAAAWTDVAEAAGGDAPDRVRAAFRKANALNFDGEAATRRKTLTEEIGQQIGRIQGATREAVESVGTITDRIRQINGVAATVAAAEEQGSATLEIVRNVVQVSAGAQEVTGNIVGVAQSSEQTGAAADHVLAAAGDLSRQAEQLSAEVGQFLVTIRAG